MFEYSVGVDEIADEASHRPRQFGFEPTSFCMWGAKACRHGAAQRSGKIEPWISDCAGARAIVCAASLGSRQGVRAGAGRRRRRSRDRGPPPGASGGGRGGNSVENGREGHGGRRPTSRRRRDAAGCSTPAHLRTFSSTMQAARRPATSANSVATTGSRRSTPTCSRRSNSSRRRSTA